MFRNAHVASVVLLLMGSWLSTSAAAERTTWEIRYDSYESLKKQLPQILSAWGEKQGPLFSGKLEKPEILLARQIGENEAKITFVMTERKSAIGLDMGGKLADVEVEPEKHYFSVYLAYFEGAWTVTRWETDYEVKEHKKEMLLLVHAIDNATGK